MRQRLLVVDDEPGICEYIKMVAEPMGFDVEVTTRGKDFLVAYDREEPSLICMDVVMPEVDGIELLRILGERNCRSPVLLISGYNKLLVNSTVNLGESFDLPYVRSMAKPLGIEALESGLLEACLCTVSHAPCRQF